MIRRAAVLALCLAAFVAAAGEPSVRTDRSTIDGLAGQGMSGLAAINQATGRGNAQANLAVFAVGQHAGARASGLQATAVEAGDVAASAVARIGGGALAGTTGLLSVNQAAGSANAQLNLLAVGDLAEATAVQSVDVTALATVAAGPAPDAADALAPVPLREARIEGAALANPQGVLQLNQTAGVGNASANAIVLHVPGGTP